MSAINIKVKIKTEIVVVFRIRDQKLYPDILNE